MSNIAVNKVIIEGNSIFIRSSPVTGIIALTAFSDDASLEDQNIFFIRKFRYSLNGVQFSDWYDLVLNNILSLQVSQSDILVIELQYIKSPLDAPDLSVTSATIAATDSAITDGFYFKNSVFSQFFGSNDIEVLNWTINVLDKLFAQGLIPNYISRYDDDNNPDDFLDFWRSVCKFFAYYVAYARAYQTFYDNKLLLSEYLEERGLKTSTEDTIEQLYYLMQHYHNEIFHRGTVHITDKPAGDVHVFGELLRLIYYKDTTDEFVFNLNKNEHSSWVVDSGSPLYRSLTIHDNANKFYEQSVEPSDISKYPTTGTVTIETDNDINKNVLHIDDGGISGNFSGGKIKVSELLDYEFFFLMRKDDGNNLTVGFDAYDKDGNLLDLISRKNGTTQNNFIQNKNFARSDKYLAVSGMLYNKSKPLDFGDDINLKLVGDTVWVVPKIIVTGATADVYNIRFCPMITPYSKGFLHGSNFIDCWLKNNNHHYTIFDLKKYIQKYLLPYNVIFELIGTERTGASDFSVSSGGFGNGNFIITEDNQNIITEIAEKFIVESQ